MHDEVSHIGRTPVFIGIYHRAVHEVRAIVVLEFQRDYAGRIAAQEALGLHAQFAAHIRCQGAFAAGHGCDVELHIALAAHQHKLHRIQDRAFAHTIDADEIRRAVHRDRGVLEQVSA